MNFPAGSECASRPRTPAAWETSPMRGPALHIPTVHRALSTCHANATGRAAGGTGPRRVGQVRPCPRPRSPPHTHRASCGAVGSGCPRATMRRYRCGSTFAQERTAKRMHRSDGALPRPCIDASEGNPPPGSWPPHQDSSHHHQTHMISL